MPRLLEEKPVVVFQRDVAPPNIHERSQHSYTRSCLIVGPAKGGPFPGCHVIQIYPPPPPHTHTRFLVLGLYQESVYVPPLPATLENLKERLRNAFGNVHRELPESIWQGTEYRVYVCRATKGAHIELR
jgi:hypothetical protein